MRLVIKRLSVLVLILVLFLKPEYSKGNELPFRILTPNNRESIIKVKVIQGREYAPLKFLSAIIFPDAKYIHSVGEIKSGVYRLKCSPGSFYLLYEGPSKRAMAQMTVPTLDLDDHIYVPLRPFIKSLLSLGLFSSQYGKQCITLKKLSSSGIETIDLPEKLPPLKSVIRHSSQDTVVLIEKELPEPVQDSKKNIRSENIEPDKYKIPENLIRNNLFELKDSSSKDTTSKEDSSNRIDDGLNSSNDDPARLVPHPYSDLYASLNPVPTGNTVKIKKLYAESFNGRTEVHLVANATIREYHKPELKDGALIIRIPDVVNTIEDYSRIDGVYPIKTVELELIRNYLLYKLVLSNEIISCTSNRNGPEEIIYTILHSGKAKTAVKEDTEPIIKKSPAKNEHKGWELDVIILDPGHGGEDPGAISINGHQEKELALKIAKKVKALVNKAMPETKVVMTREDDTFIELYKRGKIANKNKGKLFISIHLNSMPKIPWPSNGFETYILRPGRNDDAVRVANKENAVIKLEKDRTKYKKLTNEEIIIATMAQSAFVKLSERFADILQKEVGKKVPLVDRGVNQAGFYVLVGASMPNVLFEAGFLSNKKDEKYLISSEGQDNIAVGIFEAIQKYSAEYSNLVNGNK